MVVFLFIAFCITLSQDAKERRKKIELKREKRAKENEEREYEEEQQRENRRCREREQIAEIEKKRELERKEYTRREMMMSPEKLCDEELTNAGEYVVRGIGRDPENQRLKDRDKEICAEKEKRLRLIDIANNNKWISADDEEMRANIAQISMDLNDIRTKRR
ncbi:MAG: hypothetical protein NTZ42_03160 [Candidatus Gribaldobacteria bacterium]|nr:hypothetical protein [Candidatus Gribaldobacteria bacterium]